MILLKRIKRGGALNIRRSGYFYRRLASFFSLRYVAQSSHDPHHYLKNSLGSNPFTKKFEDNYDFIELSKTAYPNPLFKMSKQDIESLDRRTYLHLVTIPYKHESEIDNFCLSIIDLVREYIYKDVNKAMNYIVPIEDGKMKEVIIDHLKRHYSNDAVLKSVFAYLESPSNIHFRKAFFHIISDILRPEETDSSMKADLMSNYFKLLCACQQVNYDPLILNASLFKKMMKIIPRERYAEFLSYLVYLNIQTYAPQQLYHLKEELIIGSNLERFVAKTGWKDAKWHDVNRSSFTKTQKLRMALFYSTRDLHSFTEFALKQNDIVESSMYLELLVQKFEMKCQLYIEKKDRKQNFDTSLEQDLVNILNSILRYVIQFKGPEASVGVLKYMKQNNLELSFKTYFTLIQSLKAHGFHDKALTVMKHVELESLVSKELDTFGEEIVSLMAQKFPKSPNVALAYATTIFSAGTADMSLVEVLNELQLIAFMKNNISGTVPFPAEELFGKANVDDLLKNRYVSYNVINSIYEAIFMSKSNIEWSSSTIKSLYEAYMRFDDKIRIEAKKIKTAKSKIGLLNLNEQNDKIILIFIKFLLKVNPSSTDMNITRAVSNFDTAKYIMNDFHRRRNLDRTKQSPYLYDLLVYGSLIVHNDFQFASSMIKYSRSKGLPFSFNQMYPFILFYYNNGDYEKAKQWYEELVRNGVKATASPSKNLFKIAKELNWDVSGFVYRKLKGYRNRAKKDHLERIANEPIEFIPLGARNLQNDDVHSFNETQESCVPTFDDIVTSLALKSGAS